MSFSPFIDNYFSLKTELHYLQTRLTEGNIEMREYLMLGQNLLRLWQTRLAHTTGDHFPAALESQWRSLHTEIHRELRLLNMDLLFLGRSSQQATKQKDIGDRLNRLNQYCDKILNLDAQDTPEA
jgi:hypothetical protein